MKYVPEISSDFAILDVKKGRKALDQMLLMEPSVRFKLTIEAEVDYVWGGDDGISQEFALKVTSLRWMAEE